MVAHHEADIAQVINLARYPINDPAARQEIVRAAREQMAAYSGISLDNFLAPGIAEAMAAEALAALPRAYRRDHMFSAYPDTGEELPEDHPRRQLHPYNQWVTPGDTLPGGGLIHRLYGSDLFLGFVIELLGEAALYRLDDPLMGVVTTIMADGDQHGWHFDLNDFVVSILLQKPKAGGAYESAPHIRSGADENYDEVASLVRNTPGLTFTPLGPGESNIGMRGLSTSLGLSPSVAVYVNDTPFDFRTDFWSGSPSVEMFDMERIEVLRGPQGTLFGSSSPGGTIRFITRKPDPEAVDYHAELGTSTTRRGGMGYVGKGALNLPLSERAAIRLIGTYEHVAGFVDRYAASLAGLTSAPNFDDEMVEKNANDADIYSFRGTAQFDLNGGLTITPSLTYQKIEADGPLDVQSNLPLYGRAISIDGEPSETELIIANLAIEKDLGFANLVSSSSYLRKEASTVRDQSYFSENFFGFFTPIAGMVPSKAETYVQELRLASSGDDRLRWVAGLYYSRTDQSYHESFNGRDFADFLTDNFGAGADLPGDEAYHFLQETQDEQIAAFAQLNYDLTEQVELVAGGRVYRLSNELSNQCTDVTGGLIFCGGDVTGIKNSVTDVSPRVTLNYRPDDSTTLYVTASRGFRPGGSNSPLPENIGCALNDQAEPLFKPDSVWNYELGAKLQTPDRRYALNGAVYRLDQKGVQTAIGDPGCGYVFFANAGDARIHGVELEMSAHPLEALSFSAQVTYTDAEFSSVPAAFGAAAGYAKGDPVPETPRWKFSLAAEYRQPISPAWEGYVRGNWQYVGRTPYSDDVSVTSGLYRPDYDLVNLQVGAEGERFDVSFYVDNLFDEKAILGISSDSVRGFPGVFEDITYVRPRTIGVTLRFRK